MIIEYGCSSDTKRILVSEVTARAKLGDEAQKKLFIAMKILRDFSFPDILKGFQGKNLTYKRTGDCYVFTQGLTKTCSLVFIPVKETGFSPSSLSNDEIKSVNKAIIKEVQKNV